MDCEEELPSLSPSANAEGIVVGMWDLMTSARRSVLWASAADNDDEDEDEEKLDPQTPPTAAKAVDGASNSLFGFHSPTRHVGPNYFEMAISSSSFIFTIISTTLA